MEKRHEVIWGSQPTTAEELREGRMPRGYVPMFCVTLYENELAYDVEVDTWAMTLTHFADQKDKERRTAVVNEDLRDWLYRQVESALVRLKSEVSFAIDKHRQFVSDEIGEEQESWFVPFRIEGWRGDADVLCGLLHDYVVKFVVYEWVKLRMPQMSGTMENDMVDALLKVKSEVYKVRG